jgi:hypothetical protein
MNDFNDYYGDDFTTEGFGDTGYGSTEDQPESWAIGSDEIGNPIYCEAALSDFLQRDAI